MQPYRDDPSDIPEAQPARTQYRDVPPRQSQYGSKAGDFSSGICACLEDPESCICSLCCEWYPWSRSREHTKDMPFHWAVAIYALPWLAAYIIGTYFSIKYPREPHVHMNALGQPYYHTGQYVSTSVIEYLLASLSGLCSLACIMLVWFYRVQFRKKYDLSSEPCGDLCVAVCCRCCAIAQEQRHIKKFPVMPPPDSATPINPAVI
eukprot:g864.t1